jgi:plastocyanin
MHTLKDTFDQLGVKPINKKTRRINRRKSMLKRARVSILCATAILVVGLATYLVLANVYYPQEPNVSAKTDHSAHKSPDKGKTDSLNLGILSNASVSFGAWIASSTTPLDRFANPTGGAGNAHELIPQLALIKAGGSVNFIIAGLHNIIVYDDGTKPTDINTTLLVPESAPPLIDDPNRRIYRGPDPRTQPRDRVEVVQFEKPGTYLVICGVLPHFTEGMYGFVKVIK